MDENMETADDKPELEIRGGTETVLIVEDEESVLDLGREHAEESGLQGADGQTRRTRQSGWLGNMTGTSICCSPMW